MQGRFKYWLPAVLWMILIFGGSTNTLSSHNTSRFIGPFLRWLIPGISPAAIERVQVAVRKCGHLTEYAILSMLCWVGVRRPVRPDARPWQWKEAFIAFAVATAYAATDEIHQSFIPSRFGSPWDVLIDSSGAAAGLILLWAWHQRRQAPLK